MPTFEHSISLDQPLEALAFWHLQSTVLRRLVPAWSGVRLLSNAPQLVDGAFIELSVPVPPFRRVRWGSRIEDVGPGGFVDVQEHGPFRSWRHEHRLSATDGGGSRLDDLVDCDLGLPWPVSLVGNRVVRSGMDQTFGWRHVRTRNDLRRHDEAGWPRKTVLVTGSSGLVGTALRDFLETGGCKVRRLLRRTEGLGPDEYAWDPARGVIDPAAFEGVDAVVHLAGAGIADKRWSADRMKLIRDSRVDSSRLIAETVAALGGPAPALICASATGYYGDRPGEEVDETSSAGTGFLAETCVDWEAAMEPARDAGIRVAHLRIGVVVAYAGGALAKLRRPVLMGVAGPVGTGRQGMSWIALDDLLAIIQTAINDERYHGPINAVAPELVDNRTFMRSMGRVLRRPTVAPLPGFVVRALFGRMGQEALLNGCLARPGALESLGFRHDFPGLEEALRFELGRLSTNGARD